MSNIYALEPHTNAKVILHTTSGDIEIELWGKEAPRATRNFIQLCLEGYYDNTIFHRIVPDFLVQGGDSTGTGQGGESIYEDGFPDEFHSRLRFNRRGLVGLANTGQDDNGSQFFITLDRADELTKKHTMFGRVAGDTLFNVMKMTELEVDQNERPLYPPKIKTAEVVLNPFEDIIPRISAREKKLAEKLQKQKLVEAEATLNKRTKKVQKKQLNLLSFGEQEEEDDEPTIKKTKMKSQYDFIDSTVPTPIELTDAVKSETKTPVEHESLSSPTTMDEKLKEKVRESDIKRKQQQQLDQEKIRESRKQEQETPPSTANTIDQLKQDIRNISKPVESAPPAPVAREKKKSLVALEREKYASSTSKKKKSNKKSSTMDDSDVLNQLMAFQKKLSTAAAVEPLPAKERKRCKLHDIPGCESCFDLSLEEEDETDEGWISHQLVFDKDLKGKDLMQRKETVDDYVVIDPRDREAKAKQEEFDRKRSMKSKVGPAFRKREDDDDSRKRRRDEDDRRSKSRRYEDDHRSSRKYDDDQRSSSRRYEDDHRSSRRYEDDDYRRSRR